MSQHKLTDAQELELCAAYNSGLGCIRISRQYGVNHVTVLNILKRHNIPSRPQGGQHARKYTLNHEFFTTIATERQAYWLGFIAADGYVYHSKLLICLANRDADHLRLFVEHLGANYPVHHYKSSVGFPSAKVVITSKQLTSGLVSHGVHQAKSFDLEWPTTVPDHLISHFARGYFDGNGGFTLAKHKDCKETTPASPFFNVTGSRAVIIGFQDLLMRTCDLGRRTLIPRGRVVSLTYTGRRQVKRIYDYLYSDASVYLARKRDFVTPYLEHEFIQDYKLTLQQMLEIKSRLETGETPWHIYRSGDFPVTHSTVYRVAEYVKSSTGPFKR